jgi:hypothetical protein
MVQLTENFTLSEFGRNIPTICLPILHEFCATVLEPVREIAGVPLRGTSGYRPPGLNKIDHGQPNSEHIYTADWCAWDFYCKDVLELFAKLCNDPSIPYHQLILEKGTLVYVIHISMNKLKPGVRSVLRGATENSEPYEQIAHVEFSPLEKET